MGKTKGPQIVIQVVGVQMLVGKAGEDVPLN
jgi:hypothetical protein